MLHEWLPDLRIDAVVALQRPLQAMLLVFAGSDPPFCMEFCLDLF